MINYQLFPRSKKIPDELEKVILCFKNVESQIDSESNISTIKTLESDDVLGKVGPELVNEQYGVETKQPKHKNEMTVLFGKNGKKIKTFNVDAISKKGDIIIEVEAGRAVVNYHFLRDIFEACMIDDVEYLVIAVKNRYTTKSKKKSNTTQNGHRDFDTVYTFLEAIYASRFGPSLPLKGILLIGY